MSQMPELKSDRPSQTRDNHSSGSFILLEGLSEDKSSQRESIAQQVVSRILGMIKSGNLVTGDRLPTEQQMCVAFAISRPTLREALKALTVMGVLESRQGGRYTVTDLSSKRLVEPFNIMLSMAEYNANEHFEARVLVDLELVRLCCCRANEVVRDRIVKLAEDGHAFYNDPVAFRLLDIEFHEAINLGAQSPMLSTLSKCLYDVGLDLRRVASEMNGVIRTSVKHHCRIANAIMFQNVVSAEAAYKLHLRHIRDTTISVKINSSK